MVLRHGSQPGSAHISLTRVAHQPAGPPPAQPTTPPFTSQAKAGNSCRTP
jgi:hypothetical protein